MDDEFVRPVLCLQWLDSSKRQSRVPKPMPRRRHFRTMSSFACNYMGKLGPNEFLLRLAKDSRRRYARGILQRARIDHPEGEVLSWLSKGKTNRDIAQILGLSPRTVDKHLEQIYAKLGVENRTAAAAIAAVRAAAIVNPGPPNIGGFAARTGADLLAVLAATNRYARGGEWMLEAVTGFGGVADFIAV